MTLIVPVGCGRFHTPESGTTRNAIELVPSLKVMFWPDPDQVLGQVVTVSPFMRTILPSLASVSEVTTKGMGSGRFWALR